MALKVKMMPYERIFIGTTVVTNAWSEPAKFSIEGAAPVLRQAHAMLEERADTPLKRVYLCVQNLYLGCDGASVARYFELVAELLAQMPQAAATVAAANSEIAKGSFYGAIREYRKLLYSEYPQRDWAAELTGLFQPKAASAPVVIRAPRRGRPERKPQEAEPDAVLVDA
ncbi:MULTISPECIES: flagellar biosynthesis repressor FlbT [Rhodopseudomonas]|uniref:flagellar biosynthesis repressor FlbT n=1 Tax=Rhodopseudomonas TaxID=1073 RepID=UPI0006983827|nr:MULTISPECIES: flagellar biosynthesis repressor FlbT [Rhodopseudomonas]MDF3812299.1 flagellar biosynthesis repressor FlbT [Rhodopseudomonas sp. BAL398]WOK16044.1 flagellar biosynthesis repressor FlbT [Rhodopseudomonas sp. BAL398]